MTIHKPVLLREAIALLDLKPGQVVVDATLGGGGYSWEIMKIIMPGGKLIAIDWDGEAIERFQSRLRSNQEKENVFLINDNFACLEKILDDLKIREVKAIVADLGVSSDQLDSPERGFSFLKNGPLDMRFSKTNKLTADYIVNHYSQRDLTRILWEKGGEKKAAKIASLIVSVRKKSPLKSTVELADLVRQVYSDSRLKPRIHPATKTFQALRMEVNRELENLQNFLEQATGKLARGGRIAVISFHSGEDRIVKNFFRENARGSVNSREALIYGRGRNPIFKILTPKPIVPTAQEIKTNPRARSAKLRVAEKI